MDLYLGKFLRDKYPEFNNWKNTPVVVRMEIYSELTDRQKGWVLSELQGKPEAAKKLWESRFCGNPSHHRCPACATIPKQLTFENEYWCVNPKCPSVEGEENPEIYTWRGCNHVSNSDDSCEELFRWDRWDM
jgi:hypothetical protein